MGETLRRTVMNPTREEATSFLEAHGKPFEEKDVLFVMNHMALHYFPIYETSDTQIHPIHGGKL